MVSCSDYWCKLNGVYACALLKISNSPFCVTLDKKTREEKERESLGSRLTDRYERESVTHASIHLCGPCVE